MTNPDQRSILPPAPWAALATIVALVAIGSPTLRAPLMTVVCIAVAFYRFDVSVLLWMVCVALVPAPLVRVRNSMICLSTAVLSVLLVWWIVARVRDGQIHLPRSRLTIPLLAVAAAAVASGVQGGLLYDPTVAGVHRYVLVQLYATALVLLSVAAAFLVDAQIKVRQDLSKVVGVLFGVGLAIVAVTITRSHYVQVSRWYPIALSHAFALVYAGLLCRLPFRAWHWVVGIAFVALVVQGPASNFFIGVHSQWVSGWLMIGVPLLLLPVLCFPRFAVAAIIVATAVSAHWVWPLVQHALEMARHEGDFGRLRIWQDAILMGRLRPFLGVGLGNYIDYAERYAQVDIALGSAHGNYQQVVAEMGIVGLGFVLWLLARAFGVAWRLFRTAGDPFYRSVGLAALGGLAGQAAACVVGDYLLPAYHNGGHESINSTLPTWMVIGMLMGAERLAACRTAPREENGKQETGNRRFKTG